MGIPSPVRRERPRRTLPHSSAQNARLPLILCTTNAEAAVSLVRWIAPQTGDLATLKSDLRGGVLAPLGVRSVLLLRQRQLGLPAAQPASRCGDRAVLCSAGVILR